MAFPPKPRSSGQAFPSDVVLPERMAEEVPERIRNIDPAFARQYNELLRKYNELLEFLRVDRLALATPVRRLANTAATLDGKIDAETLDREVADLSLQTNIDAEGVARASADAVLQADINNRQLADAFLTILSAGAQGAAVANPAATTPADDVIGLLPIGGAYTQVEVQDLRNQTEILRDYVDALRTVVVNLLNSTRTSAAIAT